MHAIMVTSHNSLIMADAIFKPTVSLVPSRDIVYIENAVCVCLSTSVLSGPPIPRYSRSLKQLRKQVSKVSFYRLLRRKRFVIAAVILPSPIKGKGSF